MNYKKQYIKLIRNAQNNSLPTLSIDGNKKKTYIEKHHIFPVSIFGKNKTIIKLTAKEHFVAHHLLWKYYQKKTGNNKNNVNKMMRAFYFMSTKEKNKINSRIYEELKKQFDIVNRECQTGNKSAWYGRKHSQATKEKIGLANRNKIISEETRKKISIINTGKIVDEATKEKISKTLKNRIISKETRGKISNSKIGNKRSEETKKKMSETIKKKGYKPENNPNVILNWDIVRKIRNDYINEKKHTNIYRTVMVFL